MGALKEIGIGMLGYAFMGRAHAHAFKTIPYMLDPPPALPRLVALGGRNEVALVRGAERFGFARHYTDWRQLVADPEVAVFDNAAANDAHSAPCIAAAKAGKHVICEKPLARDATEAKQMLEAVRGPGVKHMVGFNYRFVPAVRLAYELIQGGHLGEIRHFRASYLQDWLSDPSSPMSWRLEAASAGSGALGDLGSHVIDLARFLVGELRSVAALTRTFVNQRPMADGNGTGSVGVDDAFAATLEFESGAIGSVEASRVALGRKNQMSLEINGTKGSLSFDLERLNELAVFWPDGKERTAGWSQVLVTNPEHLFVKDWWPPGHIIGWEHTFTYELAHFLSAVAKDGSVEPLAATFEDGYRTALICDAILESADSGQRLQL